jgi:hypothetical protein
MASFTICSLLLNSDSLVREYIPIFRSNTRAKIDEWWLECIERPDPCYLMDDTTGVILNRNDSDKALQSTRNV